MKKIYLIMNLCGKSWIEENITDKRLKQLLRHNCFVDMINIVIDGRTKTTC